MPSPFPGVDPYLESQHFWPDFHATFINYWREAVTDVLPPGYDASINERVQIVGLDTLGDRPIFPDIAVSKKDDEQTSAPLEDAGQMTRGAVTLEYPVMEEVRETLIEILHQPQRSLVAVLELLSPTNKTNPGRGQYLQKRNEVLSQPVHMVELDLLITGERLPMRRPLPAGEYYAIISRRERRRTGTVHAWTVRDPLPRISIPLLEPDRDVAVDLSVVFATAFDRGRFGRRIDYRRKLELPLSDETRRWAEGIGGTRAASV
jgi:hypothetical protein